MKVLILTQIMDRADATLGFFVPWVAELAQRTESMDVICLQEGDFTLPDSVRVLSLGKESAGAPRPLARLVYIFNFYRHVVSLRGRYDVVLVHMNHEYVLMGGPLWALLGKRIYLWRNHYEGSFLVDIAALFCKKVFCTSRYSYTGHYKKTVFMPTGVNVESLMQDVSIVRVPRSILSLGRLSPSKRPEFLLDVYALLAKRGVVFVATFVGGATDDAYQAGLEARARELGLADRVTFVGAVANTETFRYYRATEVFVNASKSGMLDKSMFKAMAAGALVVSSSLDLARDVSEEFVFEEGNVENLADKLEHLLSLSDTEKAARAESFQELVRKNSLPVLMDRLVEEIQ